MTLKRFDKSNLGEVRSELNRALDNVAAKFGFKVNIGNIRFTENSFRTTLDVKLTGSSDPTAPTVVPHSQMLFGKEVRTNEIFVDSGLGGLGAICIVDYQNRSRKYPVIVRRASDGKQYKISLDKAQQIVKQG